MQKDSFFSEILASIDVGCALQIKNRYQRLAILKPSLRNDFLKKPLFSSYFLNNYILSVMDSTAEAGQPQQIGVHSAVSTVSLGGNFFCSLTNSFFSISSSNLT